MTVKDAIVGYEMDNALFSSGRNNDAVIERNNMAIQEELNRRDKI